MGLAKCVEDNYEIWTENNRKYKTDKRGGTMLDGLVLSGTYTRDFGYRPAVPRQCISRSDRRAIRALYI